MTPQLAPTVAQALPPPPRPVLRVGSAQATGRVVAVRIAAAVGDAAATDRPVYARADEPVTLFAVLEVQRSDGLVIHSDARALQLGGRRVAPHPIADAPLVELRWNKIEPAAARLTNGDGADFHFEAIDYRATPLETGAGRSAIAADVHPTLTPDHGNGVGTMRYQLIALEGDRVIASAGPEARRGKGSGGLSDAVMRVSIRRDDSYLGFLTEMYGQPYIWASAGASDATHQSERLEGADCADFIVYGARRMGARIAYTYTGGLPNVTQLLGAGKRGDDGVYRDASGRPLAFPRPGDLLLFPRHVGALVADRGTIGVLDDQDVMMHALFDSPKEQAIADSGYAGEPVELRRFSPQLRPPASGPRGSRPASDPSPRRSPRPSGQVTPDPRRDR
jgi:cell wall-associated NlpC family hydrolase